MYHASWSSDATNRTIMRQYFEGCRSWKEIAGGETDVNHRAARAPRTARRDATGPRRRRPAPRTRHPAPRLAIGRRTACWRHPDDDPPSPNERIRNLEDNDTIREKRILSFFSCRLLVYYFTILRQFERRIFEELSIVW